MIAYAAYGLSKPSPYPRVQVAPELTDRRTGTVGTRSARLVRGGSVLEVLVEIQHLLINLLYK